MIKKIIIITVILLVNIVPYVLGDVVLMPPLDEDDIDTESAEIDPASTLVPAKPVEETATEKAASQAPQAKVIAKETRSMENFVEIMIVIVAAAAVFAGVAIMKISKREKDGDD